MPPTALSLLPQPALPAASGVTAAGDELAPSAATDLGARSPVWNDRLSLLLESTGEGIFGVDTQGLCTFINRAAAEMLGWRTDEVLGRNMHSLIHHSHADGRLYPVGCCPIFNAFRSGLPCRVDSDVLWRADGSSFHAEYSSHPIHEQGEVRGAVVVFVDISARKAAEDRLREAHDQLEQRVEKRTAELSRALEQLRNLSAYLETVREAERTRIARDIHDELGSLMVALKMDVLWLQSRLADRPPLRDKSAGMGRLIDRAVDNLGRIITDLRPSILDHQGLWAALEWQAQEFIETTELAADLKVHVAAGVALPGHDGSGSEAERAEGERWAIAVFRIFQEMLSNVARHARASRVRIRLLVDSPPDPVLYLEVEDNGVGAPSEALHHPKSYGLMGMRERVAHQGGQLRLHSVPGRGTWVRATMPLPVGSAQAPAPGAVAAPLSWRLPEVAR